ncbi:putative F-box domain, leucine-rich repeat domain, L domain-containing protein [Rosa chinensis]|uniref:Putative F-box domain, leucine-rich repeat domain, L domain-containing protein n=1 Tax=Rosa chinensis TaxID=74649 RepID=A0A2P6SGY7_ROSCH|nr:putative F-box domain, leucine-rich repeat domain, L domain-containing protein [Rosa chinensis]
MAPRVGTHVKRRLSRRDWTELSGVVTGSILSCLGDIESLTVAEMVCKTWREICKDPMLWRTIDFMSNHTKFMFRPLLHYDIVKMCRRTIHRSSGIFVYVNVDYFCNNELLKYITNNLVRIAFVADGSSFWRWPRISSDLVGLIRHLSLLNCGIITDEVLCEAALRLPVLEELDISMCKFSSKALQVVRRCCPLLKSFKFNTPNGRKSSRQYYSDEDAVAISGTMHGLLLLEIRRNELTCNGLETILDCCPQLEILDLRKCKNLRYMSTDLEIRCVERIKKLWLSGPIDPSSISDLNLVGKLCY